MMTARQVSIHDVLRAESRGIIESLGSAEIERQIRKSNHRVKGGC